MIKLLPLLNEITINVTKDQLIELWHKIFNKFQNRYNNYPEKNWYTSKEYIGMWLILTKYGYNSGIMSEWLDTVEDKWFQIYYDIKKFERENS